MNAFPKVNDAYVYKVTSDPSLLIGNTWIDS